MFLSFVAEVLRVVQQLPGAGDDTRRTIERDIVSVEAVDIYMITVSSKLRRAMKFDSHCLNITYCSLLSAFLNISAISLPTFDRSSAVLVAVHLNPFRDEALRFSAKVPEGMSASSLTFLGAHAKPKPRSSDLPFMAER